MQKKRLSAILCALQIAILTGCGQAQAVPEKNNLETVESVESRARMETQENVETTAIAETAMQESQDGNTGETPESQEVAVLAETRETEETPSPEILHFVDAWGEWHDCIVDPEMPRHNYDWSRLGRDGELVTYEQDDRYQVRYGVDVSKYQGTIQWDKVKASGIDFAIVRIGYRGYGNAGNLKADEYYARNIEGAQAVGMDVGVYFFSQAVNEQEAVDEADFVLGLLEGYTLQLPIVYDPELIRDDVARTDEVTGEQFTANTIAFCERIKEAGYQSMIYSNMVWESELFDLKKLQDYPIWYADYEPVPQTPYPFVMWQYTEKGTVDGIKGIADRNVWFVPVEE